MSEIHSYSLFEILRFKTIAPDRMTTPVRIAPVAAISPVFGRNPLRRPFVDLVVPEWLLFDGPPGVVVVLAVGVPGVVVVLVVVSFVVVALVVVSFVVVVLVVGASVVVVLVVGASVVVVLVVGATVVVVVVLVVVVVVLVVVVVFGFSFGLTIVFVTAWSVPLKSSALTGVSAVVMV